MTELNTSSLQSPDPEAIATAKLVLPLVLTRLESDPAWSLAMLDAVTIQLDTGDSRKGSSASLDYDDALEMSAGEALAKAHACAVNDKLTHATILARIALREPGDLGDAITNARLLLASLLERQGKLMEAVDVVAQALDDDPEHPNALVDRDRMVRALRSDAMAGGNIRKTDRIAMLAASLRIAGWNFTDVKAIIFASLSLLRKD